MKTRNLIVRDNPVLYRTSTVRCNPTVLVRNIKSDIGNPEDNWRQLIAHYMPWISRLSSRYPVDKEDLESAGVEGLREAVEGFDPTLGTKFNTYVSRIINGRILDALREADRQRRGTSRESIRLLKLLNSQLEALRVSGQVITDDLVQGIVREIIRDRKQGQDDQTVEDWFAKVMELYRRPQDLELDTPYPDSEHSRVNLRDLGDTKSVRTIDLIEDHPFEDCTFPPRDNFIYHIPSLSRRAMIMIDLYLGISLQEPMTMKDIGRLFGLSESRISQEFSSLKPLIEPYIPKIKSGELIDQKLLIDKDPFYRLLIQTLISTSIDLKREDLKNLKNIRHLLSDENNAGIRTIRGADREYCIPPTTRDLKRTWLCDEVGVKRIKDELAKKVLLLIRALKISGEPDLSHRAMLNITRLSDKSIRNRNRVLRFFLDKLGYSLANLIIPKPTKLPIALYDLVTNLIAQDEFMSGVSNLEERRNKAIAIADALLAEVENSPTTRLIQDLPTATDLLVQRIASPVLLEAKELSGLGFLTYQELGNLFQKYENQRPNSSALAQYARTHKLVISTNNFWNMVNLPKTKSNIIKAARKLEATDRLTYKALAKIIQQHTGHRYRSQSILSKFAEDNELKIYRRRSHLGLSATNHHAIRLSAKESSKGGYLPIEKLKQIIQSNTPPDFPLATISDFRLRRYAESQLKLKLQGKGKHDRLVTNKDQIIEAVKELISSQGEISLVELNRIIKEITGLAFKADASLLRFADAVGIDLSKRSGVQQVKAPRQKPRPTQPRIRLSREQIGGIVAEARTMPKGLLNERRLNSIIFNFCGVAVPSGSRIITSLVRDWSLKLRSIEPSTIFEDIDNGLKKTDALKELLLDCNIFVEPTQIKTVPGIVTELDTSIKTLAERKIENLEDIKRYQIVNRMVMAPKESEIGGFVRIPVNYQKILTNLAC